MFGFIKKLFGFGSADQADNAAQAPYKVEAVVAKVKETADVNKDGKVNLDDAKAVVNKAATKVAEKTAPAAVKLRKPGTPKQGQKKPAGNKPRGPRKPKAKPAA